MRILVTIDFPPESGGIQRYLFNLVKYTYDSSDLVMVGCGRKNNSYFSELPCDIKYYSTFFSGYNKKLSLIILLFGLLKRIIHNNEDLTIEAGNLYSALPVFLISLCWPVKYMVYCYGKELLVLAKKGWRKRLFTEVLKRAERISFITQYTASLLSGLNLDYKLNYMPPKIDKNLLEKINDKSLHDPVNLLSIGRLEFHKGHDILLEAVKAIPKTVNWKLTIAGSGPRYNFLEKMIGKYGLSNNVTLATSVNDKQLWNLYNDADLFLFPSQVCESGTEGFGIVLLEAMAKGVAIIASKAGGIPEVLENGRFGVLVEQDNVNEWRDQIINLIKNDEFRKKLINNARLHVEKYYVWN